MSDVGPYGVTQNPDAQAVTANALVGEPVGGSRVNEVVANSGPATMSTAPYKGGPKVPPRRKLTQEEIDVIRRENDWNRRQRELGRLAKARASRNPCAGKDGTCKAGAMKGTDLCVFHTAQKARRESANAT